MIRITCTNCRKVLTLDDGFAGGVCRCQACGTIQKVPAHLKGSGDTPLPPEPVPEASDTTQNLPAPKSPGLMQIFAIVAGIIVVIAIVLFMAVFHGSARPNPTPQGGSPPTTLPSSTP